MEAKYHEWQGRIWIRGIGNPPHAYIPLIPAEVELTFYRSNYRPAALISTIAIGNHQHPKKASREEFIYYPIEGRLWRIDAYIPNVGIKHELGAITEVYPHLYRNIVAPIDNELISMVGVNKHEQDG